MVKRALIFVHRWLGIGLCLLFLLWFPSGIGMMYFPMPSVTPQNSRQARAPSGIPSRRNLTREVCRAAWRKARSRSRFGIAPARPSTVIAIGNVPTRRKGTEQRVALNARKFG